MLQQSLNRNDFHDRARHSAQIKSELRGECQAQQHLRMTVQTTKPCWSSPNFFGKGVERTSTAMNASDSCSTGNLPTEDNAMGVETYDDNHRVNCQPSWRVVEEDSEGVSMDAALVAPNRNVLIYLLHILQQPSDARACSFEGQDRRSIDPPPIVQLEIEDTHASSEHLAAFYRNLRGTVRCTLSDPVGDCPATSRSNKEGTRQQGNIAGTLVASPVICKGAGGSEGCYFIFHDLSVRVAGRYQLKFQLEILDAGLIQGCQTAKSIVTSETFEVYEPADWEGMKASMGLTILTERQRRMFLMRKIHATETILCKSWQGDTRYRELFNNSTALKHPESPIESTSDIVASKLASNPISYEASLGALEYETDREEGTKYWTPECHDIIDHFHQAILRMQLKYRDTKTRLTCHPARQVLIDNCMRDFWVVFNAEWDAKIRQHSGSSSQTSSVPPVYDSTNVDDPRANIQKRPRGCDRDESDEHDNDERGGPKRPRKDSSSSNLTEQSAKFACPYRKYNPQKYSHNVRRWRSCALTALSDVSRVKYFSLAKKLAKATLMHYRGHLYRHHRVYTCGRCSKVFETEDILKSHTQADIPCDLKPYVRVEGVTCSLEKKLKSKKKTGPSQSQEERWKELYRLLFPDTDVIPSPYFEATHDESSAPLPESSQLFAFEEFSRLELPRVFQAALEADITVQQETIEEQVRTQLVNLVRECQEQVFASYRSQAVLPRLKSKTKMVRRSHPKEGADRNGYQSGFHSKANRPEPVCATKQSENQNYSQDKNHHLGARSHVSSLSNFDTSGSGYSIDPQPQVLHQPAPEVLDPSYYPSLGSAPIPVIPGFAPTQQDNLSYQNQNYTYHENGIYDWEDETFF